MRTPVGRRTLGALVLAWILGLPTGTAHAEDETSPPSTGIAFFNDLAVAREVARESGRPLLVVVHPRVAPSARQWPYDLPAWQAIYADPALEALTSQMVCVLHLVGAPPRPQQAVGDQRPETEAVPLGPTHMVLSAQADRLLGRRIGWTPTAGAETSRALRAFLARCLSRADPAPEGAPRLDRERVTKLRTLATELRKAQAPARASLPLDGPGFRMRLQWPLPLPAPDAETPHLEGRVTLYWNGEGPLDVGTVRLPTGQPVDVPLDVRFEDHPEIQARATKGEHRVDVYLEPVPGGFAFSEAPVHVGVLRVQFGDGGGGGGSGGDAPQPPEDAPPPPPEQAGAGEEETPEDPPPPPPPEIPENPEVVEPFLRDGDTVHKDDAIVAAEDEDAGVKPPPAQPADPALRTFERTLQDAVGWERMPPSERAWLLRYFEALRGVVEARDARRAGDADPPKAPR